ncbi:terminase [Rhodococcus sp. Leaf278]|uniref:hypothetical protein n=1 Tax=Rhodococcus sp. Leaf278 TaxID=1736319 RepID=UPI00070BEA9C|nr:hypothetical protein [Rhodococcus sp. Leaf278]KQU48082.1 terminase [Rhodococcus sp. Leaf278]
MAATESYAVDFPTLADVLDPWYQAHCSIPDGFNVGDPFVMADWQFWCTANHYRVKKSARWQPRKPMLNQAFTYRRSQIVGPQKSGKGPWSAAVIAGEAVGPTLFAGWAEAGDGYACSDFGCGCGFEHAYNPGEPMGMPWPTPIIQLTATSEDQVDNVYGPLTTMIENGPLSEMMGIRENFIRLPGNARDSMVEKVTSNALSRIGKRVSFVLNDETGLYTKENKLVEVADAQRRGAAGMQGRTMETTNCWNPAQHSYAQRTYESRMKDVFKFYRMPPTGLRWENRKERRELLRFVYAGCPWISIESIDAEAEEISETDPPKAERWFGNRLVQGVGAWMDQDVWDGAYARA